MPRQIARWVMVPNQPSTWLNHDAYVGVEWTMKPWLLRESEVYLSLRGSASLHGVLVGAVVVDDQEVVDPGGGLLLRQQARQQPYTFPPHKPT